MKTNDTTKPGENTLEAECDSVQRVVSLEKITAMVKKAFLLGIMTTREGANGECYYDHCYDGFCAEFGKTEDDFMKMCDEVKDLQDAAEECANRLVKENLS